MHTELTTFSADLYKRLSAISGVISSHPVLPILENFLIEIDGNSLKATASDLQTAVSTCLEVQCKNQVRMAVPARILLDTLKSLPQEQIVISLEADSCQIHIKTKQGRYRLCGERAEDFPTPASLETMLSTKLPSPSLKRAIGSTLVAVGQDEIRPAMGGIYIGWADRALSFVSTDGHRLVRYILLDTPAECTTQTAFSCVVPRKSLALLNGLLSPSDQHLHMTCDGQHISFQSSTFCAVARLIDDRYPDYENVIPDHNPKQLVVSRGHLINTLRRIAIYASKTTYQVRLSLQTAHLQIYAEDVDFAHQAVEQMPCRYTGGAFEVGFNARFLIEILNVLSADEIVMRFSEPHRACLVVPHPSDPKEDVLMLIMPVLLGT